MPIKLKNNVVGYLATAISASDTGLVLQSGNGASFPTLGTADYFYATLVSTGGTQEVVKVTARVGDTMTMVRAQEGSSAAGFAVGTRVEMRVTAQSVLDAAQSTDVVSVKSFGAVGDGSTDDAAAIQAAVNASVGKTLYFPAGTYIIGTTISLLSNSYLTGDESLSILKLRAQAWPTANGLMFAASLRTNIRLDSLVFDGNKGNVGTSRSPMHVFFRSQRIELHNCTFQNAEGISLNVSTDMDEFVADSCRFINCGGNPDNSDGYRKQAIAFSTTPPSRTQNVRITNCYFYRQGLDCISLADCDNVHISGNTAVESYTLVYTNPSPSTTTNLVIENNVVNVCSEFGAGTAVPPVAIDLVSAQNFVVANNTFYRTDTAAIGIFTGCTDGNVVGNIIVDPMTDSAIRFCGIEISTASNVRVAHNTIRDTRTPALMDFGIVVKTDATNIDIVSNIIVNPLTARFGRYVNNPFTGQVTAFTNPTQISATTQIVDSEPASGVTTHYRRLNVLENTSATAAVTITQLGTGNALVVEDSVSPDGTSFVVDADGDVGVRISPATFGGPLSVSGTGTSNVIALQQFGDDNSGVRFEAYKTRGSVYAQGLVQANDVLLFLGGYASDGVGYRPAARINFVVDGTPAAGDMPGAISFATTPSGTVTPVARLKLKQGGAMRFIPQAQPASAEAGDVYYDSGTNKLRCYNGSTWNDLF